MCHTGTRPYLKHRLVSYPVSGVDVPGHLSQFIGPGRGLPLGTAPLKLLLLLRVRGRTGHRRLQPGSGCVALKVRKEDEGELRPTLLLSVCTDGARASEDRTDINPPPSACLRARGRIEGRCVQGPRRNAGFQACMKGVHVPAIGPVISYFNVNY